MSAAEPRTLPLYLTVKEAAAYAGIGEGTMRGFVDGQDPPPMLVVGTRRYVQRDGLARYLEGQQNYRYQDAPGRGASPSTRGGADGRDLRRGLRPRG